MNMIGKTMSTGPSISLLLLLMMASSMRDLLSKSVSNRNFLAVGAEKFAPNLIGAF